MVDLAEDVLKEIADVTAEIEAVDVTRPAAIELEIVAKQRQMWANTAKHWLMELTWATKIGNKNEAADKAFKDAVKTIVEIDKAYPEAKARMVEMDKAVEATIGAKATP